MIKPRHQGAYIINGKKITGLRVSKTGKHRLGKLTAYANEYRRKKILAYYAKHGISPYVIQICGRKRKRRLKKDFKDFKLPEYLLQ